MEILTTATEVAVVDDDFEVEDDRVDERHLTYEFNEWDEYAVEEAVRIGEAREGVEVVVASIGPERSEEVVRQALAKGADRAIRVWDEAFADRAVLDAEIKARVLAAVAREIDPDLVLAGVQTGDHSWGATGIALGRELGYQWAAVVSNLELDEAADVARVHRELEGGIEEITEVDLPAVLTIQSGINEPRYASLRGIRQAQSKPLDVRTLADLGLESELGERVTLREMYEPAAEGETEYFEGSPEEQAAGLAELLEDEGVIEA